MTETTRPNPGSADAVAQGCRCPVLNNARGKGDGRGNFWISENCPIHGGKVMEQASADF